MYLWRGLPEGQLLAVLRWMSLRREGRSDSSRLAEDTARTSVEAGGKVAGPLR